MEDSQKSNTKDTEVKKELDSDKERGVEQTHSSAAAIIVLSARTKVTRDDAWLPSILQSLICFMKGIILCFCPWRTVKKGCWTRGRPGTGRSNRVRKSDIGLYQPSWLKLISVNTFKQFYNFSFPRARSDTRRPILK